MNFFNNLKISSKLAAAFFLIVLMMVALGLFAVSRLDQLNDQTNFMVIEVTGKRALIVLDIVALLTTASIGLFARPDGLRASN